MDKYYGKLKIVSGVDTGKEFAIQDGMVIGRDPSCEIFINDSAVSRSHCRINIKDNNVEIIDLESRNGTKINSKIITRAILKPNDKIEIGGTIFVYESYISKKKNFSKILVLSLIALFVIMSGYFYSQLKQKSKEQEIRVHATAGKECYEQKRYAEALAEYQYCLKLDQDNETIKNMIKKIKTKIETEEYIRDIRRYIDENEFELAEEKISTIITNDHGNPEALKLQSELQRKREVIIKLDSASTLIIRNDFDNAINLLKSLYEQYPDSLVKERLISVLLKKGYMYESKGNKKGAIDIFTEVLNIEPKNSEAFIELEKLKASSVAIKPHPPDKPVAQKTAKGISPEITVEEPKPNIQKPSVLTRAQKDEAEKLYWEAYKAEKDDKDISRARELYQKVLQTAPDSNFDFYQKAKKRLEKL